MFARYLRFTLTILILCLFTLNFIPPAIGAPNDTVITDCSNDTQLRNAVSAGGTITFNCGVATIPFISRMEIAVDTVIDGDGKITFDGAGNVGFFQVYSDRKLTLRKMTLRNGRFAGGYPVEVFGEAILDGVTVTNNQTGSNGGVVYSSNRITVRNSTFTANNAASSNNVTASGAAILIDGGTGTIEQSKFSNNSVSGNFGTGGAIAIKSGTLTIVDSDFASNFAPDGGALYVGANTQVTVTNSIFENNSARYGGAIESWGELQLDYSTLSNNRATLGDGGALWIVGSDADITYSTFDGNQAKTTGGAISCYDNNLSIIHSTISNNSIPDDNNASTLEKGGGIFSSCNLNLTNSTLSGNKIPSGGGGGLYLDGTQFGNLSYVTIANNNASYGAGIYNDNKGSTLSIEKSILANNSTGNCDGLITSGGYNLASDNNCGGFTQTGDQKNVTLLLSPLSNNGGATLTHMPLSGNPAIDHIPAADCGFSTDQRNTARPQGTLCDSGAVEVVPPVFLPLVMK